MSYSKSQPIISIITIAKNSARTIEETFASVADQKEIDPEQVEHILIDSASTDQTLSIASRFPRVIFKSERDKGISDAFNKGIAMAKGDWILFLNSDDRLQDPLVMRDVLAALDPSYDFVYGQVAIMDETGRKHLHLFGEKNGWKLLAKKMRIPHPGTFTNKKYFETYGNFDLNFRIAMDYEFFLRSYGKAKFKFIPRVITSFRSGGISTTQTNYRQALECYRAKAKNSVGSPLSRSLTFLYQSSRMWFDSNILKVPILGRFYLGLLSKIRSRLR